MATTSQPGAAGQQVGASRAGTGPVNWIDVKLHGIYNLPPSWMAECGSAPTYADHIFRYEVDVDVVGATHTFRNGRLLQNIPLYAEYVDDSKLPPVVTVASEPDERDAEVPTDPSTTQPQVASERPPSASVGKDGASEKVAPFDPQIPNAILWVIAPEQENSESKEEGAVGTKAAAKPPPAKKGAASAPPPPTEAVKPILPYSAGPPPCVVRLPLTLTQLASLEEQVEKFLSLNLTFRRVLKPGSPADWEDANELKYQATVPLSLKPLADPGSTSFKANVQLVPVQGEAPKEDEKGKGKKAAPKKSKGAVPAILQEDVDTSEGHPYSTTGTYATITFSCYSALTRLPQSRPRPELQPSDMIPKRLKPPGRPMEATKQYNKEIESLIVKIVQDQRNFSKVNPALSAEDHRAAFMAHLASSGKTHAYKELLLPSVQSIVREKFMRKPNPSKEELDRVANELYTYLVDHMHTSLNRKFSREPARAPAALEGTAAARWKRLAMEAEAAQEFAIAAKYHQERLVQCNPSDAAVGDSLTDVWCEYAEFCLRVRDSLKAEQAYREALALDVAHLPSLIGYGVLLLSRGRYKEAEVYLQSAVDLNGNTLTWGCVGLYYEALLQALGSSSGGTAEDETKRANYRRESKYAMSQALRTNEGGSNNVESVFLFLAEKLLELHHEELSSLCLSKAQSSIPVNLLYARLFYQSTQYEEAVQTLKHIVEEDNQQCQARLLLGDVYSTMGKSLEAEAQYDAALRINPSCGSGPAYLRLGNIYTALGKFKDALSAFLMGAKVWPCGLSWLGVGIAYYRMDDLTRAEQALNESNILNNLNPKTWAYLALLCLRQRREDEGDQAFNQAIKQGLADPYLIAEVGAEQLRLGRHAIAEACLQRSLSIREDCNTRMYLARTLAALRRFAEAKEQFERVAKDTTNEVQRQKAEEQIDQIQSAL